MGSSHRMAAVAAVAHAKYYYNHTTPDAVKTVQSSHYTVNIFFVSATLCGVLVAVCAACWRRSSPAHKPDAVADCGVYTVSTDTRLTQHPQQDDLPGPPPPYETVIEDISQKDCSILQEVVTEPCSKCKTGRVDSGLPSYEAAVLLRDTKL
ncbi:uncharacterized protein LOC123875660 [Maniola jurtina]|uniref:uncharacterized protein LOC123875660 n=1 Tax=Maniola jurtina TaxID=191418 RepID=UPI001E689BC2|nr:uncharacterized protein LOC123875660 [Maniola jurtina]